MEIKQGSKRMKGTKKILPRPKPMNQPILVGLGWTSGSHYKPQVYGVGGKGGVGSGYGLPLGGISVEVVLVPQKIRQVGY